MSSYIYDTTAPMANKPGKMVTYLKHFQPIKLLDPLGMWFL